MEDYKSEIEDWDLGAGVYISFYLLRSTLQGDDDINKLVNIFWLYVDSVLAHLILGWTHLFGSAV